MTHFILFLKLQIYKGIWFIGVPISTWDTKTTQQVISKAKHIISVSIEYIYIAFSLYYFRNRFISHMISRKALCNMSLTYKPSVILDLRQRSR